MDANSLSPVAFLLVLWIVGILVIVGIVPYWKIFGKAGFSPWLSLCMLVPLLNLVVLYVVAFSDWSVQPVQRPPLVPPPVLPGQQRRQW